MDPFEVRMQFLSLLGRLTSSLASIQKVSAFAFKHGAKCGDDIWDCLVEECGQVSLNARINLLYFLDSLVERQGDDLPYPALVRRDLPKLVEMVVPPTKEGNLNLMSTNQVLRSWKTRRLLDADLLDTVLGDLERRRASLKAGNATAEAEPTKDSKLSHFSRNDILRRIEDDRERHKRLRERIWVLPVPTSLVASTSLTGASGGGAPSARASTSGTSSTKTSPVSPSSPSELLPSKMKAKSRQHAPAAAIAKPPPPPSTRTSGGPELAIEIEFDQMWEASEEERAMMEGHRNGADEVGRRWPLGNEDKLSMKLERERCFH